MPALELEYCGEVDLSDLRSAFPYMKQPETALVDYLVAVAPSSLPSISGFRHDPLMECIYAQPLFVPANQVITDGGAVVVDQDQHLGSGLPQVSWDSWDTNAATQDFKAKPWGYQYGDLTYNDEANAHSAYLVGRANPLHCQGVILTATRCNFVPLNAANETSWSVTFSIGGYQYRVRCTARKFAEIAVSEDAGATWRIIKPGVKSGSSPMNLMGNAGSSGQPEVALECLVLNGKISFSINGQTTPYVCPFVNQASSAVDNSPGQSGTTINVLPGDGEYFPPAPFEAYVWRQGTVPSYNNTEIVLVTSKGSGDNWTVTRAHGGGAMLTIGRGFSIACLRPQIDTVTVRANGFTQFSPRLHPLRFTKEATLRSIPQQLGFVPDPSTPIQYVHHTGDENSGKIDSGAIWYPSWVDDPTSGDPPAVKATTVAGTDTTMAPQYDLDLVNPPNKVDHTYQTYEGQPYADWTAALSRVTLRLAGIAESAPYLPTIVPLGVGVPNDVKEITEEWHLNIGSLTIEHSASVTWRNWRGIGYLQGMYGFAGTGNIHLALQMGWQHQGLVPRFYGICHTYHYTRPSSNLALLSMVAEDQRLQVRTRQVPAPPNVDGHNHYYAVAAFLQRAGVTPDQMAFWPLVPDEPDGVSPLDANPYFLPSGIGMHPFTPVNRTVSCWDMIAMIQQLTGFMCYVDAFGMWQYHLWIPPDPAQPFRVFTETDSIDSAGAPTATWSMSASASTLDVRNQILLIGIDAYNPGWPAIVVKREDQDSIDAPAGAQPANYVGWPVPMIWMDSRFAVPGFAQETADRLYRFMRMPTYQLNLTGWLQPDLFPGQVIWHTDPKANLFGVPFYLTDIVNRISVMGGNLSCTCSLAGRYLEASAFMPYA